MKNEAALFIFWGGKTVSCCSLFLKSNPNSFKFSKKVAESALGI
jgi:hypothetical protein